MKEYYIGLLSGTSIDAVDVALFEIKNKPYSIQTIAALNYDIPIALKADLNTLIIEKQTTLNSLGELNRKLGEVFAQAVLELLKNCSINRAQITAIGFHGQTIFHQPDSQYKFTMQIGDPSTLVELVKIPVVTDFRQRDMINGGQGAPLAPLFHQKFFHNANINRAVINIGGISNITLVPKNLTNTNFIAADLGPGNTLLDQWFCKNHPDSSNAYDENGHYAQTGNINFDLLDAMLQDSYFARPWPKSTGREHFNLSWLENHLKSYKNIAHADIQRTLLELTATVIAKNVLNNPLKINIEEVSLCGGGVHNAFLLQRITKLLHPIKLGTTNELGVDPNWVEAALFAWLAACTWHKQALNLQYITGNNNSASILGCIYY